jgi:hypothetical protein
LKISRDNWKTRAKESEKRVKELEKRLEKREQTTSKISGEKIKRKVDLAQQVPRANTLVGKDDPDDP